MGWFKKRNNKTTDEGVDINNSAYGAFILSKNVLEKGRPIRYSYRKKSSVPVANGWTIYSDVDDDEYVSNPENFVFVGATTMYKIAPVMLEIFDAPYGTDLFWVYEQDVHTGFINLNTNQDITIKEILKGKDVGKEDW